LYRLLRTLCHNPLLYCFFYDTATTVIYTLSLHDALPISRQAQHPAEQRQAGERVRRGEPVDVAPRRGQAERGVVALLEVVERVRSEEHTSELQSRENLVCRLLLEKKKHKKE